MTYTFSTEDVLKTVLEVAEDDPNFIYRSQGQTTNQCSYLGAQFIYGEDPWGRPCIVGTALKRLGVTDADLFRVENLGATEALEKLNISGPRLGALDIIQQEQDTSNSWGAAASSFQ